MVVARVPLAVIPPNARLVEALSNTGSSEPGARVSVSEGLLLSQFSPL